MKEFTYTIKDEQGIHARPAGELVKAAAAYPCKVTISKDGKEVDAKRILGVMMLWRCASCRRPAFSANPWPRPHQRRCADYGLCHAARLPAGPV